ncbi:MAG TPA: sulfurtransferase, partial [Burkholderiaceae bacterium]|nr:sulfurtransferase [Burkholderiaceae bacterium]
MTTVDTPSRTLISAEQLRDLIARGTPDLVIVDTRFDLTDAEAGERSWRASHLPGSIYLHLERDLSAPKVDAEGVFRGRHPLPDRRAFAELLGRCGIAPQTRVVALDAQGGPYAARLWWLLRWMGHADVAVLDGGVDAWTAAGGTLVATATPAAPARPPYPEREPLVATTDADALLRRLGTLAIVDARAGERFRGEVEPLDKAAGHIPGALNRFFKDNLAPDGRFKPAEQLRAEFGTLLGARAPGEVVHQCGSGVTACHNLLAMEHAGLSGARLYP